MVYRLQTLIPAVALLPILLGKVSWSLEKVGYNEACKATSRKVMIQESTILETQGVDVGGGIGYETSLPDVFRSRGGLYSHEFGPNLREKDKIIYKKVDESLGYFHSNNQDNKISDHHENNPGDIARPIDIRGQKTKRFLWGLSLNLEMEGKIFNKVNKEFSRAKRSMDMINTFQEDLSTIETASMNQTSIVTNETALESTTRTDDQSTYESIESTSMTMNTSQTEESPAAVIEASESGIKENGSITDSVTTNGSSEGQPNSEVTMSETIATTYGPILNESNEAILTITSTSMQPESSQDSETFSNATASNTVESTSKEPVTSDGNNTDSIYINTTSVSDIPPGQQSDYTTSTVSQQNSEVNMSEIITTTFSDESTSMQPILTSEPSQDSETFPNTVTPNSIESTTIEPFVTDTMKLFSDNGTDTDSTMSTDTTPVSDKPESSSIGMDSQSPSSSLSTMSSTSLPLTGQSSTPTVTTVDAFTVTSPIPIDKPEEDSGDEIGNRTDTTMNSPATTEKVSEESSPTSIQSSTTITEADINQDISTTSLTLSTISSSVPSLIHISDSTPSTMTGTNADDLGDASDLVMTSKPTEATTETLTQESLTTSMMAMTTSLETASSESSISMQTEMETLPASLSPLTTEAVEPSTTTISTIATLTSTAISELNPTEKSASSPDNKICDDSQWLECDMNTQRCKCKAGMTYDSERNTCVSLEGKDCQSGGAEKLCVQNGECSQNEIGQQGTCKCQKGYIPIAGDGNCLPGLEMPCKDQCYPGLKCSSEKCVCQDGFVEGRPGSHRCYLDINATCSVETNECNSFLFLKCSESSKTCMCQDPQNQTYDPEFKVCVTVSGRKCLNTTDSEGRLVKCVKNSVCKQTGSSPDMTTCECVDGFENDWRGNCFMKNFAKAVNNKSSRVLIHLVCAIIITLFAFM